VDVGGDAVDGARGAAAEWAHHRRLAEQPPARQRQLTCEWMVQRLECEVRQPLSEAR
jgi:hypothetical protein